LVFKKINVPNHVPKKQGWGKGSSRERNAPCISPERRQSRIPVSEPGLEGCGRNHLEGAKGPREVEAGKSRSFPGPGFKLSDREITERRRDLQRLSTVKEGQERAPPGDRPDRECGKPSNTFGEGIPNSRGAARNFKTAAPDPGLANRGVGDDTSHHMRKGDGGQKQSSGK